MYVAHPKHLHDGDPTECLAPEVAVRHNRGNSTETYGGRSLP